MVTWFFELTPFRLTKITLNWNRNLIQVVLGHFVDGFGAGAHLFQLDQRPRPTIFDFQETGVAVGHAVSTANRVVVGGADLLTTLEQEPGDAPFHRYHKYVFPAIKSQFV